MRRTLTRYADKDFISLMRHISRIRPISPINPKIIYQPSLAFAQAIVIHTPSFGKPKRRNLMFTLVGAILGLIAAATIFLFISSTGFSADLILVLILSLAGAALGRLVDLMKSYRK